MATKTVKKSEPTAPTNVSREYVLMAGKQGVFSHGSEGVVRAMHAQCVVADQAAGTVKEYKLKERTVTFAEVDEVPTGEDSIGARGDVKERELSL